MFNLVEPDEFTPEEIEVIDALIDIAEEEGGGKKMANLVEPDDFSSEEIDIIDALIDAEEGENTMEEGGGEGTANVNQVGGASEAAYELWTIQRRHIRKFNTIGTDYEVRIAPVLPGRDVLASLSQVIASLLERITKDMEPTDLVRFIMQSEDLAYPISLPFMPLHALTFERVFQEVEKVLQSFEEIRINAPMQVNIIHVVLPEGGARLRKKRCIRATKALL